jgi:hypothetical protein
MKDKFEIGEELLYNLKCDKAFDIFKEIAEDEKNTNLIKAEAFNMMGVIISGFTPYLGIANSNDGLYYYLKAIDLAPNCLGALFNIISQTSYVEMSNSIPRHDLLFVVFYEKLRFDLFEELSQEQKNVLVDKHDFYLKVK